MAVTLTGAGGLFTRLGHIGGGFQDVNAIRGGAATARVLAGALMTARVAQLDTDYGASPNNDEVLDGVYSTLSAFQSSQQGILSAFKALAEKTLIEMVNDDTPLAQKTLANAMAELVRQMDGVATVESSVVAVGAQTALGTPNGDPAFVVSVLRPDGLSSEYAFPESIKFTCTNDSQQTATLGREPFSIRGEAAQSDTLSYLWPGGSGASLNITLVDATQDNATGNKLTNSDFETFTVANTPDKWTVDVGAAGVNVFSAGAGDAYRGANALEITGDAGGTLTELNQKFADSSTGTAGTLKPLTQYAFSARVKVSSVPVAGVLQFALTDGSAVTDDAAGTANAITVSLPGQMMSYAIVKGTFRTPAVLPATLKLRLKLTTAIDNTVSVFIDNLAMAEMSRFYAGGPYVAGFSGATKVITGDAWTFAVTNTYGVFQQLFERWFSMRNLGQQLPSDGAPSISDALVV